MYDSLDERDLQGRLEQLAALYKFQPSADANEFESLQRNCSHNAGVAESLGMTEVARTWRQLKSMAAQIKEVETGQLQIETLPTPPKATV